MKDDVDGGGERTPGPDEVTSVTQAGAPAVDAAADDVTTAMDVPADEATTKVDVAADEASAAAPVPARKPSRARRILVGFLIFLSCLAVAISGLTIWVHYTVMNTDGYMNLIGPIGKNPEAIANLSEYISDQAVIATDLQQRVTDGLPEQAQFLAAPITATVADFITKGAQKVLSSEQAYDLWLQVNRRAHENVVALLRGETTKVYTEGDEVKLNLLPLVSQVLVWVDDKLPGGLASEFSPPVIDPETDPDGGDPGGRQLVGQAAPV